MKTYKKFRKSSKLILACMARSKSVQIAWILMILINLTHFFIDLLEVFFVLFRKPFHYRSLFKKWKKLKKLKKRSHSSALAVSLFFAEIFLNLRDFREKNQNVRTDSIPKRSFWFFWSKNIDYPSIGCLTKSCNFHSKSWVFFKNREKLDVLEK